MIGFERYVARVRTMLCYGQTIKQIHDQLVGMEGMSEEDFFLVYHAAELMDKDYFDKDYRD